MPLRVKIEYLGDQSILNTGSIFPAQQAGIRPRDIILGIKKDKVEDTSSGDLKNSLVAVFGIKDKVEDSSPDDLKDSVSPENIRAQIQSLPINCAGPSQAFESANCVAKERQRHNQKRRGRTRLEKNRRPSESHHAGRRG